MSPDSLIGRLGYPHGQPPHPKVSSCTCMMMQVVKAPVHMPSVTAKRWEVGFVTLNSRSEVISN